MKELIENGVTFSTSIQGIRKGKISNTFYVRFDKQQKVWIATYQPLAMKNRNMYDNSRNIFDQDFVALYEQVKSLVNDDLHAFKAEKVK